jgi:ribosomal protein L7/L12
MKLFYFSFFKKINSFKIMINVRSNLQHNILKRKLNIFQYGSLNFLRFNSNTTIKEEKKINIPDIENPLNNPDWEPYDDTKNLEGKPVILKNKKTGQIFLNVKKEPTENEMYSEKIEKLADELIALNTFESFFLSKAICRKLGITLEQLQTMLGFGSVSASTTAGTQPIEKKKEDAPAAAQEPPKPKTSFVVKLTKLEEGSKFKVLKEIRALKPGMSIPESKQYVDNIPSVLAENVDKETADKWVEKIKAAGGVVEVI